MNSIDQFKGCIIGGAIGDAYGGQFENGDQLEKADDVYVWGGFNEERKYFLSDDTQLTLATCESIIELRKVDPEGISQKFAQWYSQGKLSGLGSATLQSITGIRNGGHWWLVGKKGEQAAGNGSAMRIAPLAFALAKIDRAIIQDVSRITHHNDEAYVGSLAVVLAIQSLLKSGRKNGNDWLNEIGNELPETLVRDQLRQIANSPSNITIEEVANRYGNSGYVVESVPFALFCVTKSWEIGFEQTIEEMIHTGGDTDTNASIMGQIAGAELGYTNLPKSMIKQVESLPESAKIERILMEWKAWKIEKN